MSEKAITNQNENDTNATIAHYMPPPLINSQGYFNELSSLNSVDIVQKTQCIDFFCGTCTENVFQVHYPDKKKRIIYEMHETSECCERCCCYRCRSFEMRVNNIINPQNQNSILMRGNKNCAIPCIYGCGCGKPEITINMDSPVTSYFGKVRMNYNNCFCAIFDNRIDILDKTGQLRYMIKRNCICIACFCGFSSNCCKCCSLDFDIYEKNIVVGKITKLICDRIRIYCTKGDIYTINFPSSASPDDKMLLIMATILLDSLNF